MIFVVQAVSENTVSIVIKAGSLQSMEPSELYSDKEYRIIVKVFDDKGDPVAGSTVEFGTASALITIDGPSKATTDQNGIATLSLKFTAGGVLNLYVDGSKVGTFIVNYKSFPIGASAFLICTFVIIGFALIYAVYKGPYKALRET
jgi:hypothetical protein